MSDEVYTYDLRLEQPIIAALVRQASTRYAQRFGQRPVNAIEVGFWVEGARLVVRLISNPAYEFNWIIYPNGYAETVDRASYGEYTTVPSWELLNNLSGLTDVRVRDDSGHDISLRAIRDGYQEGWRDVVNAIGRNAMRVVFDSHADLFAGVLLTAPCEVMVYEDEDSHLAWYLSISGGAITFKPTSA
ncbi:unnamed protein product [Gemmata massiliana]|uniref:Uncharacterized protein n=1 Tax=Gemmata massiliana TaxID=1210884 RepID=A0A6P2CTI6_9BACT|nr:hypothetical protein [Gemmata massiliana]VTR92281.1 unnamed protein product [Gemmata massiliana]